MRLNPVSSWQLLLEWLCGFLRVNILNTFLVYNTGYLSQMLNMFKEIMYEIYVTFYIIIRSREEKTLPSCFFTSKPIATKPSVVRNSGMNDYR